MNNLLGREKFEKCKHKGYRRCPQYSNPSMEKAILEDITPSGTPIMIHAPSDEDKVEATKLCESCLLFRAL